MDQLKEVSKLKYHGSFVSAYGGMEVELSHKIGEGTRRIEGLPRLGRNRGMTIGVKVRR